MNTEQEKTLKNYVETGIQEIQAEQDYKWLYEVEVQKNESLFKQIEELQSQERQYGLKTHCLELASRTSNVSETGIVLPLTPVDIIEGAKLMLAFITEK